MHKRTSSAASRSNIPVPPIDYSSSSLSTPPRTTTALMPGHHRHTYSHPYTPDVSLFPHIQQNSPPPSPSKSLSPLPTTSSDPFYISSKSRLTTGLGISIGGLNLHLPRSFSATPTKRMRRLTLLAFLALLVISAYTILIVPNSVSRRAPYSSNSKHGSNSKFKYDPNSAVWRTRIRPHGKPQTQAAHGGDEGDKQFAEPTRGPPSYGHGHHHLQLTPEQELAALASFMTALSTNALPPSTSPSSPIDPQLILDFDFTRPLIPGRGSGSNSHDDSDDAAEEKIEQDWVMRELAVMQKDVWHRHPIVLFGSSVGLKARVTRELTMLLEDTLEDMKAKSGAVKKGKKKGKQNEDVTLFVVDRRADAHVLTPTLLRLTGAQSLPILLIGGQAIGVDLFQTTPDTESSSSDHANSENVNDNEEDQDSSESANSDSGADETVVDEDPATSVLRTVRALNEDGELVKMIEKAMGPGRFKGKRAARWA